VIYDFFCETTSALFRKSLALPNLHLFLPFASLNGKIIIQQDMDITQVAAAFMREN
jgi:hypothetical protein